MLRSFSLRQVVVKYSFNLSSASFSSLSANLPQDNEKNVKVDDTSNDNSKLVAAAFASLKDISKNSKSKNVMEEISSAKDLNSLLRIAENPYLSRSSALTMVTILANWASEGKIQLADFEVDTRFAKICRILGRSHTGTTRGDMADLSVVLGVTADEQAAKLISSISSSQMIKILKSLSLKKRRSTPLLQSLAFHISSSSETLNIKEVSDVFYALAELNYLDEVLLAKIREDFRKCLPTNKVPAVVCSVIKSLGILRYRDKELLDELTEWIIKHAVALNTKEMLPLLFTLASVNYVPENFPKYLNALEPHLNEYKMVDVEKWVDVAWSLIVLEQYHERVIDSVLNPEFISKLEGDNRSVNNMKILTKIRLLQINCAAKKFGDAYKGHSLDEELGMNNQIPVLQRKDKQFLIDSVKITLSSVVSNFSDFMETNVDSNLGFFIDVVCYLDKKSNFLEINSYQPGGDAIKVALMVCDFHDFCRGSHHELIGSAALKNKLLSGIGYTVVTIPYFEYNPKDALMNRVRLIHEKIKEVISET